MSKAKYTFKHTDATRLVKAATAAGLKVKALTHDGKIVRVEVADGAAPAPRDPSNPWEQDDDAPPRTA
jgi:hypothetical protein